MESNSPAGPSQRAAAENRTGDVDGDGEIVDLAIELERRAREASAYGRLMRAVCTDEAAVDVDDHVRRVLRVVRP